MPSSSIPKVSSAPTSVHRPEASPTVCFGHQRLRVHAIDVGRAQLHQKLRADPRVISKEGVNARHLTAGDLPERVQAMVLDVSFISLKLVLPTALEHLDGWLVALVKPQFEIGL